MGFPRQEYWSGLPFPSLAPLPNPGIELVSTVSLALQVDSLTTELTWRLSWQALFSNTYPIPHCGLDVTLSSTETFVFVCKGIVLQ